MNNTSISTPSAGERAAKELAEQIVKAVDAEFDRNERLRVGRWNAPREREEILIGIVGRFVTAALAACAREARYQEANAAYWSWKLSHEDFGANQQKRLDELRKEG